MPWPISKRPAKTTSLTLNRRAIRKIRAAGRGWTPIDSWLWESKSVLKQGVKGLFLWGAIGIKLAFAQAIFQLDATSATSIALDADEARCDRDSCTFSGNVFLKSPQQTLSAQLLRLEFADRDGARTIQKAIAMGQVLLIEKSVMTACERLTLNADLATGALAVAEIRVKRPGTFQMSDDFARNLGSLKVGRDLFVMRGDKIVRTGKKTLLIDDVYFTPCDCGADSRPTFSIHAKSAKVVLDDYALLYRPDIQPLDLKIPLPPLLNFPLLYMPLSKRKSGLMPPRIEFWPQDGVYVEQGFFWAINQQFDATVALGYNQTRGVRSSLEFRYAPITGMFGTLSVSHIHDFKYLGDAWAQQAQKQPLPPLGAERFYIGYQHTHGLDTRLPLRLNLTLYSDRTYPGDFSFTVAGQALAYAPSRAVFEYRGDDARLSLGISAYQDIAATRFLWSQEARRTLQRLPDLVWNHAPIQIGHGVLAAFDARLSLLTSLQSGSGFYLQPRAAPALITDNIGVCQTADDGNCKSEATRSPARYGRAQLQMSVSRPSPLRWLSLTPEIVSLLSINANSLEPTPQPRFFTMLRLGAVSQIGRIYRVNAQTQLRHRIMPSLQYSLLPTVLGVPPREGMNDVLDERDLVSPHHQLALGLHSDLFLKSGSAAAQPLLAVWLRQYFNLGGLERMAAPGVGELLAGVQLTQRWFSLNLRTAYNYDSQEMREILLGVSTQDNRGDRLNVSYVRVLQGGNSNTQTGLFELSPGGAVPLASQAGSTHNINTSFNLVPYRGIAIGGSLMWGFKIRSDEPDLTRFGFTQAALNLDYVSPCDCFAIGVGSTFPYNVFEMEQNRRILPFFNVRLTIGAYQFGVTTPGAR